MGLMAERGAQRMQARQTYRTMARMQRRRSFVQSRVGMKEDFTSREEPVETTATSSFWRRECASSSTADR
jgi:hypothetical protein